MAEAIVRSGKKSATSYYVYLHLKADTGEVFYVGKGKGQRAYTKRDNQHWKSIVEKHGYRVQVLEYFSTEEAALARECELIAAYRASGIRLANKTDGGEGVSGLVHREESRRKMSESKIGRSNGPHSEEAKQKIAQAHRGRVRGTPSDEHRAKLSKALKGRSRVFSPEHRANLDAALKALARKGRKGGRGPKGRPRTPEEKARISAALKGRPKSEETRARMSAAQRRRSTERKQGE